VPYSPPAYADLRADLVDRVRARVDGDLDTSDGELPGQLTSLASLALAEAHEKIAEFVDARDPDNAAGTALETHAVFAGLERASGEKDGTLRRRREDELSKPMATSRDELWQAITEIDGVFDVVIMTDPDTAYLAAIYTIYDDAVSTPETAIAEALLECLPAGTQLTDPGTATTCQATDSQGVTQSFDVQNLEGADGEITAVLDITVIVPNVDDVSDAEVAAAAMPPDVDSFDEGEAPADAALVLNTGARNTRFGYPITRADVTRRIFAALPQVLDVAVLTTSLALDVDVPLGETEAAVWHTPNFTITVTAA
jgi:hypothetical protein